MKIEVPDIGDFTDVPVIEVLVSEGDEVTEEQPLITLESDKASMDVPSPAAGTITKLLVGEGDTVSEGTPIAELETAEEDDADEEDDAAEEDDNGGEEEAAGEDASGEDGTETSQTPDGDSHSDGTEEDRQQESRSEGSRGEDDAVDVVVLGAGPGGYTAAFRAADLGLSVTLVERHRRLGGVCLNVGCIPSKALLHLAKVITEAAESPLGLGDAVPDLDGVRDYKDEAVDQLTGGLDGLAKRRKITVMHGEAQFTGAHTLQVGDDEVEFKHAIIAAGSTAASLPFLPDDDRVMDSTGALELHDVPERLLVIGGGIIGLEMATVYDALGSQVTVVELADQLIPGCDADLVKPLHKRIEDRYAAIHLDTSVEDVTAEDDGLHVTFGEETEVFDRVLVAVGRQPNGGGVGADAAGVEVDERGFIAVDDQQRTNVEHIFAIGDVVGEPMLAHKATHEGAVAAEVIAGEDARFDARAIPSVAYTDPEVAWAGLTETRAKADGVEYETAAFPWAASGRALGVHRSEGTTKLLVDPETRRVLGAGITGVNAGELIAEAVLAIEMGAVAEDLALSVHPHPTLSETVGLAAEVAAGTVTDIVARKR